MKQNKIENKKYESTFGLAIFLSTIGIFVPVVIQIIYSNFNYSHLNENLIVLRYLFLPAVYLISSALIYLQDIKSQIVNNLIILNVLLLGISFFFIAYMDKFDYLPLVIQNFLFLPLFKILGLFAFAIIPFLVLSLVIFYRPYKGLFNI